ncbi:MAG: PQQ-dependent sugar dehydrogenase [Chloroflexota bacterium]
MNLRKQIGWLMVLAALLPLSVQAQEVTPEATALVIPLGSQYEWTPVASGFNSPVLVANAGDGSGRLFVVEQDGYIFIVPKNGLATYRDQDAFLDISPLLSQDVFQGGYTERGLLGLAFSPDFKDNGLLFVAHTDKAGQNIVVARYHVNAMDSNRVDLASRKEILTIPHPQYDHNAGSLAFGKDGYLYIGVGDGGSQGDSPGAPAQDLNSLLGKMLRIDVSGDSYSIPKDNPLSNTPNTRPEIWAYGLRNPWRFSFDRQTGDLYIGDVGQSSYEEIDFEPASDPGSENYGWNRYEGLHPYNDASEPPDMTPPVAEYPHMVGCAVSGGYVYRGTSLPELQGIYIFGDYCTGHTWSLFRSASGTWTVTPFIDTGRTISSFGEDEQGELYLVDFKGTILRLARAGAS